MNSIQVSVVKKIQLDSKGIEGKEELFVEISDDSTSLLISGSTFEECVSLASEENLQESILNHCSGHEWDYITNLLGNLNFDYYMFGEKKKAAEI